MTYPRSGIGRRTVLYLGISQLVCWGISYYLIGVFGEQIAADLGWSRTLVYGGFSMALLVMGVASPLVGRLIDRLGGARVMSLGSLLIALGTTGVALAHDLVVYYAAWLCLGIAMRATLYDAAFATLARIGGPDAGGPIAQVTLLGGLASTCFWPIGHLLADAFGWRGALAVYALIALSTVPLHLAIPKGRYEDARPPSTQQPQPDTTGGRLAPALLYAIVIAATNALNSGMSAHMIGMLTGLGLAASAAVWISALRGIGQSLARLAQVLFGRRVHPLDLNLAAAVVLTACFAAGFAGGLFLAAAAAFAFFYGAGNGILTITRGTLPLVLFNHRTYGAFVGKLLVPSFLLSAAAPFAYAAVIEAFGVEGGLWLSIGLAATTLAAAIGLKIVARPRSA